MFGGGVDWFEIVWWVVAAAVVGTLLVQHRRARRLQSRPFGPHDPGCLRVACRGRLRRWGGRTDVTTFLLTITPTELRLESTGRLLSRPTVIGRGDPRRLRVQADGVRLSVLDEVSGMIAIVPDPAYNAAVIDALARWEWIAGHGQGPPST